MLPDICAYKKLNPLITEAGYALLKRLHEHPDAPRWNQGVGDHLLQEDLAALKAFRRRLEDWRGDSRPADSDRPPVEMLEWVQNMRARSAIFGEQIAQGFLLARDWAHLPTLSMRWQNTAFGRNSALKESRVSISAHNLIPMSSRRFFRPGIRPVLPSLTCIPRIGPTPLAATSTRPKRARSGISRRFARSLSPPTRSASPRCCAGRSARAQRPSSRPLCNSARA